MRECYRNIELFFLLEQLTPDFRTISDFQKDNSDAIKQCFYVFTQLCVSLNLYDIHEILSIDGSKFRAVNGNKKMFNDKILDSKLERIEKKISEYLELLAKEDEAETSIDNTPPNPKEHLTTLKQRKKLYESYKAELAETGETQKLITDPEARMMHTIKDGYHCCFNVQTAVSGESHLIVDYEVTNHINDQGILHDFTEKIKKNQQKDTLVVVADKGYECKEEIISSIENGIIPYVGFRDDKDTRLYPLEFMPETITEAIRCSTKPADIQKCLHSGVLPACFERTHISVEVKEIGEIGAFSRGEDKEYVTCPMGKQLKRVKDKGPGKGYKCCTACRSCDNRCTASANPKSVYFGPHTDYVAAYMYGGKQANKFILQKESSTKDNITENQR